MRLVHLSDLHLGFRAYEKTERGWNQRERDVASAFRRALQATIRLRPDLVLVTGDVFDGPDPPSSAFLSFARGASHLRANLPGVPILVIAGGRDSPRAPSNPGPVGVLDALPMVEAAASAPRSVRFRQTGLRALLVPHRAAAGPPFPEIAPDDTARWNVLLVRGRPNEDPMGERQGLAIDPSEWGYVAIGGDHRHRQWAPNAWTAGALERPSLSPWADVTDERGFVVFDLAKGEGEFHAVSGRPVVDLAPVRVDPGDVDAGTRRLRDLVQGLPGGVDGRILRVRLRGELSSPADGVSPGLLDALRRNASHLSIRLDPSRSEPDVSRTGWRPDRLILAREDDEPDSVSLASSGLILIAAATEPLLVRIGEEVSLSKGVGGRLFSVVPEPPRGSVIDRVWFGNGDPEDLIETIVRATGDPLPERWVATERSAVEDDQLLSVEARIRELRGNSIEASGDLEAATLEWARERQDAESKLDIYRDRAREIRDRIREIETQGSAAPCPTCGRPLGDGAERLLEDLRGEWEGLVQDGRWWRRRREQLDTKSEELREMEEHVLRLHAEVEQAAEEAERLRATRDLDGSGGDAPDRAGPEEGRSAIILERPDAKEILRMAGDTIARITMGRLAGVRVRAGRLTVVALDGTPKRAGGADAAALRLAVHIACWTYARSRGVGVASLLVPDLWRVGDDGILRGAIEALAELGADGASVLVVGPAQLQDLRPEVFTQVVDVAEGAGGRLEARPGSGLVPMLSL